MFKNSTFYRGEWLRGQVHGKGEMVQHGNIYTGNFAYDLKVSSPPTPPPPKLSSSGCLLTTLMITPVRPGSDDLCHEGSL